MSNSEGRDKARDTKVNPWDKNQSEISSSGSEKLKNNQKSQNSQNRGSSLNKSLTYEGKVVEKPFVNVVSRVPNVPNVPNVPSLSWDEKDKRDEKDVGQSFLEATGRSLKNQIISFLSDGNSKSYEEIALGIKGEYDSVKKAMQRNSDYFKEEAREGNIIKFVLTDVARLYLEESISNYYNIQGKAIKSLSEREKELKNKEQLKLSLHGMIMEIKKERRDNLLFLDFKDISECDPVIADKILENPDLVFSLFGEITPDIKTKVIIKNLPESQTLAIENLRAEHIDKLISLEVRCVSLSDVRPKIVDAKFECPNCGSLMSIKQETDQFRQPSRCTCGWRTQFKLISQELVDSANLMLEDLPEKTEHPNTRRVKALIQHHLTEKGNIEVFTPGNEIKIVGILRSSETWVRNRPGIMLGQVFEVLHGELFQPEVDISRFTEEDIMQIKEVANKINDEGLKVINTSFAPDIYGHEQIKNAIILQLCARKNDPKNNNERNKANILLMGDPGISKSVMGKFAVEITPGSRKAVGGGASAVGVTAAVVKQEESLGGYSIEPGALILAKDLLFLDEVNNMNDEDKPKLQEGLSEQSVTINKANIHVSLKVTAGVLAAANPKHGKFVGNESYISQFNITPAMLNRFDIIFVMEDKPNIETDRNIARKMIQKTRGEIKGEYDKDFLRKFFVYIRNTEDPIIDKDTGKTLEDHYINLRRTQGQTELMINPRFFEALKRLVRASAKIRLSSRVQLKDIKIALEILEASHFKMDTYHRLNLEATPQTKLDD